ncbi:MAG: phenylalanine--tRNA ligase subunit beta [Clostridia bacterium]|nr:phenylalanine--tRNA ligase subunit beta [Clostridia bacterium]
MIVTYKWLNDFIDLSDYTPQQVADLFTSIGYEVEEMKNLGKGLERVVIGKIQKITRHPNADKLQVCQINIGKKKLIQIITAATNVFEGAIVPVALDGADLPCGKLIKTSNMRGLESQGMLCGGEELGIDDSIYKGAEFDGIMIIHEKDVVLGSCVATILGLDDVVYDISVLANRPDCQSVKGLAKELAAAINKPLKDVSFKYKAQKVNMPFNLEVLDEDCPYYLACVVKNVKIEPSPLWLQQRLKMVGMRPINNIVDITNYVLFELGQPMHAFDYDKIRGQTIVVRKAKKGEKVIALDNIEYELNQNMIVIADAKGPIGLAGIKGGAEFSVSETTKNIIFESASFKRENIRKTSRTLGLRTDASARFERGVAPVSCVAGLDRALALIAELKIGTISNEMISNISVNSKGKTITFDVNYIERLLGIQIPEMDIIRILGNLGIIATIKNKKLNCITPAIRTDLEQPCDIVEELIRYYGFDKLQSTNLEKTSSIQGGLSQKQIVRNLVADTISATGAHQIMSYSFVSPKQYDKLLIQEGSSLRNHMQLINPLSLDYSIMRTQLIGSLLEVVSNNISHKNSDFALFEIASTYQTPANVSALPQENTVLAYVDARNCADYLSIKSIAEMMLQTLGVTATYKVSKTSYLHPNISADIMLGNKIVGKIGKVHPKVVKNFDINTDCYYFELYLDIIPPKKQKKVKPLPKFPASVRDMAVVVDDRVLSGEILTLIKKTAGELCEDVELFDVYKGKPLENNQKNLAWKLTFRKKDGTLTQQEVNEAFDNILEAVSKQFGATLRQK